jgi:hypothetical protein
MVITDKVFFECESNPLVFAVNWLEVVHYLAFQDVGCMEVVLSI